jgi:hypothetical protein
MKINHDKIERFKAANQYSRAVEFDFYDKNGEFATVSKLPFVVAVVHLMDGTVFSFSRDEFESLGDYQIKIGFVKKDLN